MAVPGVDCSPDEELRPVARVGKQVALGHTASRRQGQTYNSGFLNSSPFKKTTDAVDLSAARKDPPPAAKLPVEQQSGPQVMGNAR